LETILIEDVNSKANELSSDFNYSFNETAIILAAGHGKRIKSHKSKMLHCIWGVPTVERVYNACISGIQNLNTVIVVGIKAVDVIEVIGKREHNIFAYQEDQKGTGHAVQIGMEKIDTKRFTANYPSGNNIIYILPGDMGLLDKDTIKMFREQFINSKSDMMVLT
jgi:bifunctional UDP-N-acetylglucosamine pyrophosphorylase/glucosamine-1-phosphate N-acetyltransferase